ncbi:MAG TPA: Na+/H+ antiporter NhaA [Solirubrobacterales bacterium]|nr:Na+/H+ antiporter NhaA [Solirubrobacterales bacterium]
MQVLQDPETTESRRDLAAQVAKPMRQFLATESGSAGLLLLAAVAALIWSNSPVADSYDSFWGTALSINVGDWSIDHSLRYWIDEALMALFFFVIGMEVRRELAMGELTDRKRVTVAVLGGIGGMLLPAAIFLAINAGSGNEHGWGIVIATDTAFLLGALAIVGPKFPTQLRVFLLTLAIVDDIVAISVIGIFYSESLDPVAIAICVAALALIALFPRIGVWRSAAYFAAGFVAVIAAMESGFHATLAGMIAGLLVAAYPPQPKKIEKAARKARAFRQSPLPEVARSANQSVQQAISPNERFQNVLHPFTSFLIVPLFALANAGVDLRGGVLADALASTLTWGIVAGLVLGKTLGITAGVVTAIKTGVGEMPRGIGKGQTVGGAALSGIGFTISLLIARLAYDDIQTQDHAVVGIFIASILAVLVAWAIFKLAAVFRGEVSAGLPRFLDTPFDPERDHYLGNPDAPFVLVEYGDYECPYCGRATGMIRELRERMGDEMVYVYRHLALVDVHPHAELAAEAAEAANAQGRFWEMHVELYDHQGDLDIEDLIGYAGKLDLDVDRFVEDVQGGRFSKRVQQHAASGDASGAHGTPTFFVNGIRHTGAYDAISLAEELRTQEPATAPD